MRERVYEIIEKSSGEDIWSSIYDYAMIIVIVLSMIPLAFKQEYLWSEMIDKVTAGIFIIDYLLRLATADYKFQEKGIKPFIRYPFSFMAIIDLLSVLPSMTVVNSGFKLLRLFRMFRAMRVVRVFKVMRYSRNIKIIAEVLKMSKDSLTVVGMLAAGYILVSALIVFNVEPDSFGSFFDAVYWATVSLTTVGYGDIYPVSTMGRIITMFSSVFGIAVVALPASIITAGYMKEVKKDQEDDG